MAQITAQLIAFPEENFIIAISYMWKCKLKWQVYQNCGQMNKYDIYKAI